MVKNVIHRRRYKQTNQSSGKKIDEKISGKIVGRA
jgi:hypothetical protein